MGTTLIQAALERQPVPPRVLVLTGGLIHLVNQLAVALTRPSFKAARIEVGVLFTGALTWDPELLTAQQRVVERWLALLRRQDPTGFGVVQLITDPQSLRPGDWTLACLNNQWQEAQREPVRRLGIPELVICGDGLGIYYRTARELRALLPSLLNRPIPEPRHRVHFVVEGRQPCWHRPPGPVEQAPRKRRGQLFDALVASFKLECESFLRDYLELTLPGRACWLCPMPNLAHQFPGHRIPTRVLEAWLNQLSQTEHRFDRGFDRLLLLDHPKAPPAGSFGPDLPAEVAGPIRTAVPVEVLVRALEDAAPGRRIIVAGMTSALFGVRSLTSAEVVWLGLGPLWKANPHYRNQPLEFLHRLVRVRRMALLTAQLGSPHERRTDPSKGWEIAEAA